MGSRVDDNRIRLSGVYQISNTIDSRVYIGSSISMYNRFSKHRCSFKFNRHENPNLLKFYNKYGLKCLKFEILEYCKPSMLKEREGFYLSRVENLFNVCMYPYSAKGFKHSIETCKKLSKIHSGKVLSEEHKKNIGIAGKGRIVSQKTRDLISSINNGRIFSNETRQRMSIAQKNSIKTIMNLRKLAKSQRKPVYQYTLYGDFIKRYDSYTEASRQTGILHISDVCTGRAKTAGGFKWKYEKLNKHKGV